MIVIDFRFSPLCSKGNENTYIFFLDDSYIERDLSEYLIPITIQRNHNSSSECSSIGIGGNENGKSHRKHRLSEASDGSCSSDSSGEYYAHEVSKHNNLL